MKYAQIMNVIGSSSSTGKGGEQKNNFPTFTIHLFWSRQVRALQKKRISVLVARLTPWVRPTSEPAQGRSSRAMGQCSHVAMTGS